MVGYIMIQTDEGIFIRNDDVDNYATYFLHVVMLGKTLKPPWKSTVLSSNKGYPIEQILLITKIREKGEVDSCNIVNQFKEKVEDSEIWSNIQVHHREISGFGGEQTIYEIFQHTINIHHLNQKLGIFFNTTGGPFEIIVGRVAEYTLSYSDETQKLILPRGFRGKKAIGFAHSIRDPKTHSIIQTCEDKIKPPFKPNNDQLQILSFVNEASRESLGMYATKIKEKFGPEMTWEKLKDHLEILENYELINPPIGSPDDKRLKIYSITNLGTTEVRIYRFIHSKASGSH